MSLVVLKKRQTPLFLRFIFPTPVTSLWPVDFPFKIFISGNRTRFQFFFSKSPFFQKIIENPIIKPHANRWMSRPVIRIMVADSGILTGICFFVWISLQLKEIDHAGIKFVNPEQDFHQFRSRNSPTYI